MTLVSDCHVGKHGLGTGDQAVGQHDRAEQRDRARGRRRRRPPRRPARHCPCVDFAPRPDQRRPSSPTSGIVHGDAAWRPRSSAAAGRRAGAGQGRRHRGMNRDARASRSAPLAIRSRSVRRSPIAERPAARLRLGALRQPGGRRVACPKIPRKIATALESSRWSDRPARARPILPKRCCSPAARSSARDRAAKARSVGDSSAEARARGGSTELNLMHFDYLGEQFALDRRARLDRLCRRRRARDRGRRPRHRRGRSRPGARRRSPRRRCGCSTSRASRTSSSSTASTRRMARSANCSPRCSRSASRR